MRSRVVCGVRLHTTCVGVNSKEFRKTGATEEDRRRVAPLLICSTYKASVEKQMNAKLDWGEQTHEKRGRWPSRKSHRFKTIPVATDY